PRPPCSPLFPYTTLFRSARVPDLMDEAGLARRDDVLADDAPAELERLHVGAPVLGGGSPEVRGRRAGGEQRVREVVEAVEVEVTVGLPPPVARVGVAEAERVVPAAAAEAIAASGQRRRARELEDRVVQALDDDLVAVAAE